MNKLGNFSKKGSNAVTLIGLVLVILILFTDMDSMYVIVVLGAMNCLYGLFAILTKKPIGQNLNARKDVPPEKYSLGMGICQLVMGLFILVMGIVYIKQLVVGQTFWNIILVGIVVLMIVWYILRMHSRDQ